MTLEKDCECLTHDGPHWLHMDEVSKALNRPLLESGTFLSLHGFAKEEAARLREKLYQMTSRNIAKLLPND